jgi:hypothetical protein
MSGQPYYECVISSVIGYLKVNVKSQWGARSRLVTFFYYQGFLLTNYSSSNKILENPQFPVTP